MNCNSCSTLLPPGVAFCPSCGSPTPYNSTGQGQGASPYDPTYSSTPYNTPQMPPTGYGTPSNPYGYPQPQDPYSGSSSDPYNAGSSGAATPSQLNPYQVPQNPPSGSPSYGYNPSTGYPPQGYAQGALPGVYNVPPKPRSRIGMIIGITVLVLIVSCVAFTGLAAIRGTGTITSTKTTTIFSDVPQTSTIDPAAKATIFNLQMTSTIDKDYYPTNPTTTFKPDHDIYMTFHVDSQGQNGYIKVNWYLNGLKQSSSLLNHSAENDHGYFVNQYSRSGDGAVAAYWCLRSNCADAKLAQVMTFTVTATS